MATAGNKRLAGKRCVVTGAAQGIAWAATQAFLREGAEVMAVDVNEEKLNALPDLPGLSRRVMDVRDRGAIMRLAEDFKGVNVLFNCAGYVHMQRILETTVEDWDKSFDVNVKSMFHFTQAFLPQMQQAGGGSVINMSSVVSHVIGLSQRGVYGATKAAVVGFTKGLASEHIREGIRVNVVCPGPIETQAFVGRSTSDDTEQKDIDVHVKRRVDEDLMGRLAKPEELTGLLIYLASDESWCNTGNVFVCDSGYSLTG